MRGKQIERPKPPKTRLPRYQSVSDGLRRRLADGSLAPGIKLPALRDLADEFKVSTNTVRVAIRSLEREGFLYHVPAVGAFVSPNYPGQDSTLAVKTTIALATIDIGGLFEMGIAKGIEQACQERGWSLQIYDAQCDSQLETRNLGRLKDAGVRGAIIMPICDQDNIETLFKLKLAGFPMVLVDRAVGGLKVDVVHSDNEKGAYLAVRHLLDRGHRRVFMVTEPAGVTSIDARVRGYERAMLERGLHSARESIVWMDPVVSIRGFREGRRYLGAYEAIRPVLQRVEKPVAIFAHSDYSGWGTFEACRELGLRIPEDVSVLCFDDSDITRALNPPVSTMAQRPLEIGGMAVDLIARRLEAGKADLEPRHVLVDVDLIERNSVAVLPS
jgi:DNA-binding LacI/PurR family transcriptional regulator